MASQQVNSSLSPGSRWLHAYAVFVACATFLLIIAGALVTSNDAALSIPSWPTPLHWPAAMGPGGRYELSHRAVAGTVSALTVILALWLWRSEPRRWMRRLGAIAVLTIIAQALLGGITVLFDLPVAISVSHACLGQIFFCISVSLGLFTGSDWRQDWPSVGPKIRETVSPSLRTLTAATTAAIFLQLLLGAGFRHSGFGIAPHIAGALVVALGLGWVVTRVLSSYSDERRLLRPALLLGGLLVVQLLLGVGSYVMKLAARDAGQPLPPVVAVTTAHVAVGALVLASSLVMTIEIYRVFAAPGEAPHIASEPHKATA